MTPLLAAVGHGATAYWYLTRSTGLVALVLLSATVVLGLVSSVGWTSERWPRFMSEGLHRNVSLFCIVFVAVHVATTVGDGYVPITFVDSVVPFLTPYRTIWIGLGALSFDMLVAVTITSALRRRIGLGAWRAVHWLAYLCWPVAVLHGLGSGTDTRLSVALVIYVLCAAAVLGALVWRLVSAARSWTLWRLIAATGGVAVLLGTGVFAVEGPLRPGWSHRAGTSSALLSQLGAAGGTSSATGSPPNSGSISKAGTNTRSPSTSRVLPALPFQSTVQGTIETTTLPSGQAQVTIRLTWSSTPTPLVVQLVGNPVRGGIAATSSQVTFGSDSGVVTILDGSTIAADLEGPGGTMTIDMALKIDNASHSVTGTVTGSADQ